ncbi:LacI family DNA-binding transcriptional regulator [Glycomyces luteolus]|uniref:LacI family DNA-binding transcriptional regulator n=1 Tax=Glycomyces luteolus TaxID=2670330 RepID=A0A9X3P3W7_9ACTN|nr:LacI family DNA-binding transcriptional regulator [Glycomyces luteolus]MDA1358233.1 LacI family DNA-binding transcriptional regulator [Glycomyces luteolus]
MQRRVTIEDIAREAGVSRQTVTRAMNGMPRISEATRARILEISERLGYRPSRFASNLARTSKTKTIAFVVDSFRNPYYSELAADLLDAASARGWQMTIVSHEDEPELQLISRLANQVDAVVGYLGETDEAALAAAARGVPLVLLGRTATSEGLHSVDFDFGPAFAHLVDELRKRGSKRFGLLESQPLGTVYKPSTRRIAYEDAVDPVSAEAVVVCEAPPQSVDAGELGFNDLMDRFPETDTVIAFSDLMAMGALRAAHRRGIDVPGQVRLVGVDGLSLGAVTSPALTTLAILGTAFAEQIADVIGEALDGAGDSAERRRTALPILWRESA